MEGSGGSLKGGLVVGRKVAYLFTERALVIYILEDMVNFRAGCRVAGLEGILWSDLESI